jgi:UDP-N-acetylglucosamine 3-dehydrogenase
VGWFGERHCQALASLPAVELAALCDTNEARLDEMGRRFGVGALYTDYRSLLADPAIDAVSIVTMIEQHAAPTTAALQEGKHVFLEKPMAASVTDCRAIVYAARASDRYLMVGHICRFNPRFVAAQRDIASGKLGKIVSMYARRNVVSAIGRASMDNIGPIIGNAVHDTDLMLWFSGARIESAYARSVNTFGMKHADVAWTMYQFDSGAIGVCENVWCLPDASGFLIQERLEIIGTEGVIYLHEAPPAYSLVGRDGWHMPDTTYWPDVRRGIVGGALAAELGYFVNCVQQGTPPTVVTPEEAMAAVQACLAAESSAATGKTVSVQDFE